MSEFLTAEAFCPEKPEPGIYRDVPAEVYHRGRAASSTLLAKMFLKSALHAKYQRDHPEEFESDAKARGEAIHTAMLEPERFAAEFIALPDFEQDTPGQYKAYHSTKEYKAKVAAFEAAHPGQTALPPADMALVMGMRDAIWNHPEAGALLRNRTESELTLVWNDEDTGVRCKARLDGYSETLGYIADLKSTRDASTDVFERSIFDYGYFIQASHYPMGATALGLPADDFAIIAVESEPPHGCQVFRMREQTLELGRRLRHGLLLTWVECCVSGNWPGYPTGVRDVGVPAYRARQLQEAIEQQFAA